MGNSISTFMSKRRLLSWSLCIVLVTCFWGGVTFSFLIFSVVFRIVPGDTCSDPLRAWEVLGFTFWDRDLLGTASGETKRGPDASTVGTWARLREEEDPAPEGGGSEEEDCLGEGGLGASLLNSVGAGGMARGRFSREDCPGGLTVTTLGGGGASSTKGGFAWDSEGICACAWRGPEGREGTSCVFSKDSWIMKDWPLPSPGRIRALIRRCGEAEGDGWGVHGSLTSHSPKSKNLNFKLLYKYP